MKISPLSLSFYRQTKTTKNQNQTKFFNSTPDTIDFKGKRAQMFDAAFKKAGEEFDSAPPVSSDITNEELKRILNSPKITKKQVDRLSYARVEYTLKDSSVERYCAPAVHLLNKSEILAILDKISDVQLKAKFVLSDYYVTYPISSGTRGFYMPTTDVHCALTNKLLYDKTNANLSKFDVIANKAFPRKQKAHPLKNTVDGVIQCLLDIIKNPACDIYDADMICGRIEDRFDERFLVNRLLDEAKDDDKTTKEEALRLLELADKHCENKKLAFQIEKLQEILKQE